MNESAKKRRTRRAPVKGTARRSVEAVLRAGATITEQRTKNGMRVIVAERHDDPVVAVLLFYLVGARNETEREAGVSHFLEHMMFKGSSGFRKGEVDLVTTVLGGNNNAYTGADHTAYWFELASDRWEKALEIEADRMRGLLLDGAEFEAEKQVVLEELAMGDDDPWRSLVREVQGVMFGRHPYARPIIGFEDTLRALGVEQMRDYYRRFYHPANALLVICGDVRPEDAMRLVRKHFGGIEAGLPFAEAGAWRPPFTEPKGERRLETRWDDPSRRLCIAWPTVPVGSDEDFAFDLITVILSSGRLSRLQRRLVHGERLATNVSASNDTRVECGSFWLYAECAPGAQPEHLEAVIDEELDRLRTELVSPVELRRAQRMLASSGAYDNETASDLAEDLGEWAADSDWRIWAEADERLARLTARDLRAAAQRFLGDERRVIGWSLPLRAPTAGGGAKR